MVITDHSQCEDDEDSVVTCPDDVTGENYRIMVITDQSM